MRVGCGTVVFSGKESPYALCVHGCVRSRRFAPDSANGGRWSLWRVGRLSS